MIFDLEQHSFETDIARGKHSEMLESLRIEAEKKRQNMDLMLENLYHQYDFLTKNPLAESINRKMVVEDGTIASTTDVMYSIFEDALILDNDVKDYYKDTLKEVFSQKVSETLKENSIITLKDFKTFIEGSSLLSAVCESAYNYVSNNVDIYTDLLETHYNSKSVQNRILEACSIFTESDSTSEQKIQEIKNIANEINKSLFSDTTSESESNAVIARASDIKNLLFLVGLIDSNSLQQGLNIVLPVISRFLVGFYAYGKDLIFEARYIRHQLSLIMKKLDENSDEYGKMQNHIIGLDKFINEATSTNPVNESFDYDRVTPSQLQVQIEQALYESDMSRVDSKISTINKLFRKIKSIFNPYDGLEHIKLVNSIMREEEIRRRVSLIPFIGDVIYTITAARRVKNLPKGLADRYIGEAEKFKDILASEIKSSHNKGNKNDLKIYERQFRRLENFISYYKYKTQKKRISDLKESNFVTLDDIMESSIEISQVICMYEVDEESIDHMIKIVRENDSEDKEDKELLLGDIHSEVCTNEDLNESLIQKYAQLEFALFESIFSFLPDGLSESAHRRLQEGDYPEPHDLLDKDEKDIIDTVAKVNKKDKAIQLIRDKVVSVIQNEEERVSKRDEEEQETLNRMSPDEVEKLKESAQDGSSLKIGSTRLNMPETLFEAIVMNRSKNYIQEASSNGEGINIKDNKNTILSESIVLYTIHETFNTLGFDTFDREKVHRLMNSYYYNK